MTVSVHSQDGLAVMSVSDEGVGIPRNELALLFRPFSRLSTGREASGTGLGLYIARAMAQAHGGEIRAESPGAREGSTFTITLPLEGGLLPRDCDMSSPDILVSASDSPTTQTGAPRAAEK